MDQLNEVVKTLSHVELTEVTRATIYRLLCGDPLLSDLPADVTLEEIISLISVEQGQAITIYIERRGATPFKVYVPQSATVRELKKTVARCFETYQQRTNSNIKISWKYLWKNYNLCYDSLVLDDDHSSIEDYGIKHKTTLIFKKTRKNKETHKY